LVTGGSLGALTLNESILGGLKDLEDAGIQVLWQAGKFYIEEYTPKTLAFKNVKILPFLDRMDYAYAAADVVVARAGALTISELCASAKAAILVPSPNVAEDHQTANAMSLVTKDAAILVKDIDAREQLVNTALELLKEEQRQAKLEEQIKTFALPDAAEHISAEALKLTNFK